MDEIAPEAHSLIARIWIKDPDGAMAIDVQEVQGSAELLQSPSPAEVVLTDYLGIRSDELTGKTVFLELENSDGARLDSTEPHLVE